MAVSKEPTQDEKYIVLPGMQTSPSCEENVEVKGTTMASTSKQSRWETANRARGLCACGREPLTTHTPHKPARRYAQCRRCLARQRKRTGYKGGRTKYGLGSPPGPRGPRTVKTIKGKRSNPKAA